MSKIHDCKSVGNGDTKRDLGEDMPMQIDARSDAHEFEAIWPQPEHAAVCDI
jgi:hypothetical protein